MSVIIGKNLVLTSVTTERDPKAGIFTVRVYEGTSAAIYGLIASLSDDQKYETDDSDAPLWRCTIRTPDEDSSATSTEFVNDWELLGNYVEKDLKEHPRYKDVTDEEHRLIDDAIQNPSTTSSPALTTNIAVELYQALLRNQTHYATTEFVLRKTQTVSLRYQTQVAFTNFDKLHTSAQVIDAESIPNDILFALGSIPTPVDIPDDFAWRWLKKAPQVRSTYGNKSQIIQEYWLDLWSTNLYAAV